MNDGDMKLSSQSTENRNVKINRSGYLARMDISEDNVVSAGLLHSNKTIIVRQKSKGKIINGVDSLITSVTGIYLSITVADCLPIFIFDPSNKVIALIHAGWRGLASDIISRTMSEMRSKFDVKDKSIIAGIGPGIEVKHFVVKKDVASKFKLFKKNIFVNTKNEVRIDLKGMARQQLINAGVLPSNIEVNKECTYCLSKKFFSHRRDKSSKVKAVMVIFGIKKAAVGSGRILRPVKYS